MAKGEGDRYRFLFGDTERLEAIVAIALQNAAISANESACGQLAARRSVRSRQAVYGFTRQIALFHDATDGNDLVARKRLLLTGFGQRLLDVAVFGAGDFHGDAGRDDPLLDPG